MLVRSEIRDDERGRESSRMRAGREKRDRICQRCAKGLSGTPSCLWSLKRPKMSWTNIDEDFYPYNRELLGRASGYAGSTAQPLM